eukprot:gene1208-15574_t
MDKNSTVLSQLFAVFLISNAIYRVIGNVYRSECRRDALFIATDRDKVVSQTVGGVLQTIKNIRLPLCAKQCTGNNQCQSLNFKKDAISECEILSFNKTTAGAVIENKPGWIHYEPINQTGPRCRLVVCDPGYQCVEKCSILSGYECIENSDCGSYTTLTGGDRHVNFIDGSVACDSSLTLGWYRFMGAAGTTMYTSCPEGYGVKFRCKTHAGGWLSGSHPSTSDGIVDRTVCFAWSTTCCYGSIAIKVKNCGGFYIYQLKPTPCSFRYCGY